MGLKITAALRMMRDADAELRGRLHSQQRTAFGCCCEMRLASGM
jgi:hypothetical protein